MGSDTDKQHWNLDPSVTFLNHGSFGATPKVILAAQRALHDELERNPVDFFQRKLTSLLDASREAMADFVNADPAGIAFVQNSTTGINTVIHAHKFRPTDQLLVTNHEYNACHNALQHIARRDGAKVVVVDLPFPFKHKQQLVDAIMEKVTPMTRLALIDHVTGPTGVILPIEELIPQLHARGVETVIDGAHALGMLPIDLTKLDPTYYVGNCHKWMCGPKTSALLFVSKSRREKVRPLTISHGANASLDLRSRFHLEFDWMGTTDPTAQLVIPQVLDFFREHVPGGWAGLRAHNHALVLEGRNLLCHAFHSKHSAPDECIGSMATIALPGGPSKRKKDTIHGQHELQVHLKTDYNIEVPIVSWGGDDKRWVRISAQLYNTTADYEKLVEALKTLIKS